MGNAMSRTYDILLVDDDQLDRTAIMRGLESSGMPLQVKEASSASEALNILQHSKFDCVFLDYRLASGNGLEALKAIRSTGDQVPVIIVTAYGNEHLVVEMMKAGATEYLPKASLSPEVLASAVRATVGDSEGSTMRP